MTKILQIIPAQSVVAIFNENSPYQVSVVCWALCTKTTDAAGGTYVVGMIAEKFSAHLTLAEDFGDFIEYRQVAAHVPSTPDPSEEPDRAV